MPYTQYGENVLIAFSTIHVAMHPMAMTGVFDTN